MKKNLQEPLPSDPATGVEPTRNYGLIGKSHALSTGMFKGNVFDVFMFQHLQVQN